MNSIRSSTGADARWPRPLLADEAWRRRVGSGPLGPAHGALVVRRDGSLLASTDGPRSILAFAADGTPAGSLAAEFAGIHAMVLVDDAGEDGLLCTHLPGCQVVLLAADGRCRWRLECPMESGAYRTAADFKPTAAARLPDGRLFVADGYGASLVHEFDAKRRWVKSFGGAEAGPGQLRNCHGLALDSRGPEPRLLVCDRRNRRLVHFDLEGNFVAVLATDLRRPCGVAFFGDTLAVAELEGRISLLDGAHRMIAVVGGNPDPAQWANYELAPEHWRPGVFNAPHAVAFDGRGHLYVSEWSLAGRLTKLTQPDFPVSTPL